MNVSFGKIFTLAIMLAFHGPAFMAFGQSTSFKEYQKKDRNSDEVYFKSGTIIPEKIIPGQSGELKYSSNELIGGGIIRVLQFDKLPDQATKRALESAGVKLLDYIPNRAFISFIPQNTSYQNLEAWKVGAIAEYKFDLRTDRFIKEKSFPDFVVSGSKVRLVAHCFPFANFNTFSSKIESLNPEIINSSAETTRIEFLIEKTQIHLLSTIQEIRHLEIGSEEGQPENFNGRTQHRSNTINTSYLGGKKYDGTGIKIMMQDDGDVGPHIDRVGRLNQTFANTMISGAGDHGDHVSGTFMGAGNLDPLGRGMAPGAFGHIHGNSNNHYTVHVPNLYTNDSVYITTKSYSNGCNAGYNTWALTLDTQATAFPNLLHIFSAGNAGTSNCGYGAGAGWGNVTGGHKIGKNVIAVAALEYNDQLAGFSSRGPAYDGRIKPDVSAKGVNVYSTGENFSYFNSNGTSMSCPGVSGTIVQLYHAFRDHNSGNYPNSALMKAIVLNSADDIGNAGPDFKHGWGRINANNAYTVIENHMYMDSSVASLSSNTHVLNIPAGLAQAKIMLYWKDPAASLSASFALVNDLDMQVVSPGLNTFLPLVLNESPNPTTLDLPAIPGTDQLNNMEQVVIDNPAAGSYTIQVNGAVVPQGPQDYFIVYYFDEGEVNLTYPIGGEPFAPGEIQTIRWDALNNALPFTLEYSLDSGANWTVISSSVSGTQRFYDWTVPSSITGKALVRVSQGGNTSISHAPFSIIDVPANLDISWACTDSLLLSWDSVPGADSYEVSMLGSKYMDSIGVTSNSYFIVKNISSANEYWLSVKALNQSQGAIGRRAIAFRKVPGVFLCPVPNDVSIVDFLNPLNTPIPTCQNLDSVPVSILISNTGTTKEGNFPVRVVMNTGATVTVQVTDSLDPLETKVVNFPVAADLSIGPSHIFRAWTDLATDSKRTNDTAQAVVSTYSSSSFGIPYTENFDQFSTCSNNPNCAATSCVLSAGWTNLTNNFADDIDWRTFSGATASGGTGPNGDHTTGSGNYLYLEASGNPVCSDKTALLISPCFDLTFTQQPELRFWYHMLGADMGELHVDILSDGQWFLDVTAPIIGNKGPNWLERVIDLTQFSGTVVNIRFRGTTGNDFASDICIDDISITDNFVFAIDGALTQLISPSFQFKEDCLLPDSLEVTVAIQNVGANPMGNIPILYSLNGGSPRSGVYNNILQPGSIDTFTLAQKFNLPGPGTFNLKVWNNYSIDMNPGNDTINHVMNITPGSLITVPYAQTFDVFANCGTATNCEATICNLMAGWKNYTNLIDDDIDWRVNSGGTNSQNTGPSNDQNLGTSAGKYVYMEVSNACDNKVAIMESPCIDLTNVFSPEISIWYHMFGADIGELHFDVFLGDQWILDFVPPIIGDQGNSWQQWNIDMSLFAGNIVSVRFRGISETGFMGDIALDNFTISSNFAGAQADFTYSQPTCSGQAVTFTDNSSGSALSYSWDFGSNAVPATANGAGPHTVTYTQTGLQQVRLVASNIAGSDTNIQTLLMDTLPTVNFIANTNDDTVTFINQSSNFTSLVWDFGDSTTSTDLNPVHVYAGPGIYTVVLTVTNGCGVNVITKDVTVGMVGLSDNNSYRFQAYPNPNDGAIYLKGLEGSLTEKISLVITDLRGVEVYSETLILSSKEVQIDIRHLSNGMYLLRIDGENLQTLMKIEKQ